MSRMFNLVQDWRLANQELEYGHVDAHFTKYSPSCCIIVLANFDGFAEQSKNFVEFDQCIFERGESSRVSAI